MPDEFNFAQSAIPPGLTVIEASAGTGKTYAISHLVPRLLLDGTVSDLSQVLLVTFTRDAARELADRVRRVLLAVAAPAADEIPEGITSLRGLAAAQPGAAATLSRALGDLDLLTVCTIHSFCQRTLQQEGALCGLPVMPEVVTDDRDLLESIVRAHWTRLLRDDSVHAAIAVQQGWQLQRALDFIQEYRRRPEAVAEPPPTPFRELQARVLEQLRTLREGDADATAALVREVPKWKQGGPGDSGAAVAWVQRAASGDSANPAFWWALAGTATLPDYAGRKTKAEKAAQEALTADPWLQAARELAALFPGLEWSWFHHLAAQVTAELEAELARRRLITQDGLIGRLHAALIHGEPAAAAALAGRLASRYAVVLIDESQDTDPRQFAIFRRAFLTSPAERRVVLVGDPKQAIYGFRGADLGTYLDARDQAVRRYTLTRTHRAPAELVGPVNALFHQPNSFLSPRLAFPPATSAFAGDLQLWVGGRPAPRLEVWLAPDDPQGPFASSRKRAPTIAARVATTIRRLLAAGATLRRTSATGAGREEPVHPGHFAVLVATNQQAEAMAEALAARNLPAVVNSGADVFASPVARELLAVLTAVLDPRRKARLRAALASRLIGLTGAELDEQRQRGDDGSGTDAGSRWLDLFVDWQRCWQDQGLAALLAAFDAGAGELAGAGFTRRFARQPLRGERDATDYRHLTDLLLEASRHETPRPDGLVRWLAGRIARAEEGPAAEEHQLQLASDRQAVQVLTMHKAKGLEFPLVFCPFLAEPTRVGERLAWGTTQDGRSLLLNLGLLEKEAQNVRRRELAAPALEERLRLAYVALTRAQAHLWTCSYTPGAKAKGVHVSPLDWLLQSAEDRAVGMATFADWTQRIEGGERAPRHAGALAALGAVPADADGAPFVFGPPPEPDELRHEANLQEAGPAGGDPQVLPAPELPRPWKVTSFSRLTGEKQPHGPGNGSAPSPGVETAAAEPAALRFRGVPGGTDLGTVVHDWIQDWDLSPVEPAAIARQLAKGGLLAPRPAGEVPWAEVLAEMLNTLRTLRLPGMDGTPLHRLCPEAHASEWNFHLPLRDGFSLADVADCFGQHAAPEDRGYGDELRQLAAGRMTGFLQGFIDRLVRYSGGWGLIDWKTNQLGPAASDYREEALRQYARESHYFLQCHLYLVALRRHLATVGEDPGHANQAWLVFLRGIAPDSAHGVLRIAPPEPLLAALEQCFAPARP